MKRWRWVRLDVLYAIHDRQIAEHGGSDAVDTRNIEAGSTQPQKRSVQKKSDIATLAAAYAYGLCRSHAFADGNKRTAWVAARLFLADNGYRLQFDPAEAVRTMESLAAGTTSESALADWFRQRITKA